MLLTKEVEVKWNSRNKKWFIDKGYVFTKLQDSFIVKVEDLSKGSSALVKIKCDCEDCKNPYLKPMRWKTYNNSLKEDNKYYCKKCAINLYGKFKTAKTKILNGKSFEKWCIENNRQDILSSWDYKLNKVMPSEINCNTNIKYYFKCPENLHESELKCIRYFTNIPNRIMNCNQCNSFEQWCIEHNEQDILNRWDYKLNNCNPNEVNYGTANKYYFKCPRGLHESELNRINDYTIGEKTSLKCRQCNSFAQWGMDNSCKDFLDKYWDCEKNTVDPWDISWNNHKNVWIKCQEKEYHGSYKIICADFIKGSRCPYCANRKVHILDSLGTLFSYVLSIWSNKNKKSPYEYSPKCGKEVWWKCPDGIHEDYKRKISNSNNYNFRCPECIRERDESFLQEKVRLYLESLNYTILHEHKCNIIAKNPKKIGKNYLMPYDNEVVELKLIVEVHGGQHYIENSGKWFNKNFDLHKQQLYDRYKRIFAKRRGYFYLEIPYWTDDKEETWKKLIDVKISEIKNINKNY
jgi:hypothetical protein